MLKNQDLKELFLWNMEYSLMNLTFMGPCIDHVFYQEYQQDAMLYNILYYCQRCTCFRRFLRPSSGAQKTVHTALRVCQACVLLSVEEAASKLDIYPMLCVQFFELLMMGGETA
jgi:hypothetical protein